MAYLGLIDSPKRINPPESEVLKALEIAYSENPQFADFDSYRKANPDLNDFFEKMFPTYRKELGLKVDLFEIIGFNPFEVVERIKRKWYSMTPTEQVDTFLLLHNFLLQLRAVMHQMTDIFPEIKDRLKAMQEQGKAAEQHSNVLNGIRTDDLDEDLDLDL